MRGWEQFLDNVQFKGKIKVSWCNLQSRIFLNWCFPHIVGCLWERPPHTCPALALLAETSAIKQLWETIWGASTRSLVLIHPVQSRGLMMEKIPPGNLLCWSFQFSGWKKMFHPREDVLLMEISWDAFCELLMCWENPGLAIIFSSSIILLVSYCEGSHLCMALPCSTKPCCTWATPHRVCWHLCGEDHSTGVPQDTIWAPYCLYKWGKFR